VIAILGFSLYDTVVVFDKIKENTTTMHKSVRSYAEEANLAVNQTLVRSINTSIVALIPIGAILYVSTSRLGASSLQDLALAQFVGMAAGVYSSVMLAPRILVHLKSTETGVKEQARRARAKKRAMADRYATVPAFTEEAPVVARDRGADEELELYEDDELTEDEQPVSRGAGGSGEALGKGRVAPSPSRPVGDSRSSGRQQPVRQPRSKRGKK
jgi:preprotein translocase subunit SecF